MPIPDPTFADWSLPMFSMEERERRWGRVRALMRRDGIDCIIGFNTTGVHNRNQSDLRYLTQLGNNADEVAVCFPIEGKVTALTNTGGIWPASNWVGEAMPSRRQWSRALTQCLDEAGMQKARVGVCGLAGSLLSCVRQPDGYVPYTGLRQMEQALPGVKFVNASGLMGEARFVKSPEEVEFLRHAVVIAERGLNALLETAGVGVFEPLIMANMYRAAISAGGSMPLMYGWISGPFGDVYPRLEQPVHRTLKSGDYLMVEIEGKWGGYTSQVDQSVTFGKVPSWAGDAYRAAVECFHDILKVVRPGVTFGELQEAAKKVNRLEKAAGSLVMHGRGLGDDGPLITPRSQPQVDDIALQEGNVFMIKPSITYHGKDDVGHVGDTVMVTKDGAQRLGTRPLEHYLHFA
jgi:Xaa-Pro aminopeptidase